MKKSILLSLFTLLTLKLSAQQNAQFSQYMFNGIYINPAYAGYKEELNLHSFYRNQWVGIEGAPKSMSIAVDAVANEGNVGLAFQVTSDRIGAQNSLAFFGNYAYRLRVGNSENARLSFGLAGGLVQNSIDGNKLSAIDLNDTRIPVGFRSSLYPDAKIGIFYADDRWYAGASADNLIGQYVVKQSNQDIYFPTPRPHYYLTAGALLPINESLQLKPSFLLKDDRGGPSNLDVNAFFLIADKIWLGGSYRTAVNLYDKSYLQKDLLKKNAIVAMTEFFVTPQVRFGYAFDYSLTNIAGYSAGTHEISVGFYFRSKQVRMFTPRSF